MLKSKLMYVRKGCVFWRFDVRQQEVSGGLAPHNEDFLNALHADGKPANLLPYQSTLCLIVDSCSTPLIFSSSFSI